MRRPARAVGWLLTFAYRVALYAFPRDFRMRFGPQMLESFEYYRSSRDMAGAGIVKGTHGIGEVIMQGIGERFARLLRHMLPTRARSGHRALKQPVLRQLAGRYAADARFALRSFRRTPVFTFTALAILTIGIGASTAVFSVVNALVFRGLPFPDAGRLVRIVETYRPPNGPAERRAVSYPDYLDWIERETKI